LCFALQSGDIAKEALDAVRADLTGTTPSVAPASAAIPRGALAINDALDVLDEALYAQDRSASAPATPPQNIDYAKFSDPMAP
jgi:hypothetical protein